MSSRWAIASEPYQSGVSRACFDSSVDFQFPAGQGTAMQLDGLKGPQEVAAPAALVASAGIPR